MNRWLIRAVGMTVVHVVARTVLGLVIVNTPTHGTVEKFVALGIAVLIAFLWGGIDGIRDVRAHPDPDDQADLVMIWIKAAIVAALVSGVLAYVIDQAGVVGIAATSLFFELTAGASGTALMILVPASIAILLGRWLGRTERAREHDQIVAERHHHHHDDQEESTEVFHAVGGNSHG